MRISDWDWAGVSARFDELLYPDIGMAPGYRADRNRILLVLFPVGIWITRSSPAEMGLVPDESRKSLGMKPIRFKIVVVSP